MPSPSQRYFRAGDKVFWVPPEGPRESVLDETARDHAEGNAITHARKNGIDTVIEASKARVNQYVGAPVWGNHQVHTVIHLPAGKTGRKSWDTGELEHHRLEERTRDAKANVPWSAGY